MKSSILLIVILILLPITALTIRVFYWKFKLKNLIYRIRNQTEEEILKERKFWEDIDNV